MMRAPLQARAARGLSRRAAASCAWAVHLRAADSLQVPALNSMCGSHTLLTAFVGASVWATQEVLRGSSDCMRRYEGPGDSAPWQHALGQRMEDAGEGVLSAPGQSFIPCIACWSPADVRIRLGPRPVHQHGRPQVWPDHKEEDPWAEEVEGHQVDSIPARRRRLAEGQVVRRYPRGMFAVILSRLNGGLHTHLTHV